MAFTCGKNRFHGTADGLGYGDTKAQAEEVAIRDGNRNDWDTENAMIRRVGKQKCPEEYSHLVLKIMELEPLNCSVVQPLRNKSCSSFVFYFSNNQTLLGHPGCTRLRPSMVLLSGR